MNTENTTNDDTAPSWEEVTPTLVEMTQRENTSKAAWAELRKMAVLADRMKLMVPALNAAVGVLGAVSEDCDPSEPLQEELELASKLADLALSGRVAEEGA